MCLSSNKNIESPRKTLKTTKQREVATPMREGCTKETRARGSKTRKDAHAIKRGSRATGGQRAFKLHAVFLGNEQREKYAQELFLGHITDHNGKAECSLIPQAGYVRPLLLPRCLHPPCLGDVPVYLGETTWKRIMRERR